MVLSVADLGDGEQRRDRPALDDLEAIVDQAPFDVLGAAEVRFDPPAQLRESNDLRIRQCRLLLPRRLDRLFLRPAGRRGVDGKLLGGDRLGDDLAVAHLVDVRVHQTGDQGLAEAEAGLHGGDLPVRRDRVGCEQDAGCVREDHLLHDHGHLNLPVTEAVPQAVGHGPLGEQRRPAAADVLEDRRRPHDVQVRVLLAREGCRRQVLRRRARSHGVGGSLAELGDRARDRRRQIVRDGNCFEGAPDLRAERADRLPVVRVQARQSIEPIVDRRRSRHDPPKRLRRHAEAGRHADAFDPRQLPQVRALAADDRDLRLVDLMETQHVAAHPLTFLSRLGYRGVVRRCRRRPPANVSSPANISPVGPPPAITTACSVKATLRPDTPTTTQAFRSSHFPRRWLAAGDYAARQGACRKRPCAVYVGGGERAGNVRFSCRPLRTATVLPASARSTPRQRFAYSNWVSEEASRA